jgi:hypothetical protein
LILEFFGLKYDFTTPFGPCLTLRITTHKKIKTFHSAVAHPKNLIFFTKNPPYWICRPFGTYNMEHNVIWNILATYLQAKTIFYKFMKLQILNEKNVFTSILEF